LLQAAVHAPARPPARPSSRPPRRSSRTDGDDPGLSTVVSSLKEMWEGRMGQATRMLIVVTVPITLILLVTQTAVLEAAVSQLPPSVARMVRGAQNYVIVQFAPVRDGLRWIDVPDPRTRRADKLSTTAQADD
jgi:hypothetical protein